MTKLRLAYVHWFKDRHGHVRHYFRRAGCPSVTLPGLPGSVEFMAAYGAALNGKRAPIGGDRTKAGTFNALAVAYYSGSDFAQLAKVTQATYRNLIEGFRAKYGELPVASLERKHVLRFMDAKAGTPTAANALLKMIRILVRFGIDRGILHTDPTQGVRRVRYTSDGFRQWSEDDIATFEAHWPSGNRERLAMALLLYTGQRPGDVSRMGRQHIQNGVLTLTQRKTGTRLSIPIHATLQAELDHVPAGQLAVLLTQEGKSFSDAGFSQWFSERARWAKLGQGCTAHGLRKAAARRLAEAGCTAHQIASITGHKTLREVERYTRAVDQERLAVVAMASIPGKETAKA